MTAARIHETASVEEGAIVGAGSSVWHHAQVRGGAEVGTECVIGKGVYIGAGVHVGDRCKIQNNALVYEGATVHDGVFIGPGVIIANDRFPRSVTADGSLKSADDWVLGEVVIESGASIGAGAIIVPDARIGRWALIGSGAVVTADVGAHQLVVGSPARAIGYVCVCGHRLVPLEREWGCEECGRTFLLPDLEEDDE
jgi:UDP-2-acetamido-3-amino-2,3-dideoxy-glucuronate N-acetyltransferase